MRLAPRYEMSYMPVARIFTLQARFITALPLRRLCQCSACLHIPPHGQVAHLLIALDCQGTDTLVTRQDMDN